MSKAAYCAGCGTNVYLNDDGLCPQGHGVEYLSNYYEAPDLTPADQAHYDAVAPVEKRKTNKTLVIVLAIVGVLVVCGIAATVFGVIGFSTIAKSSVEDGSEVIETIEDSGEITEGEIGGDTGGEAAGGFDAETELVGLTSHFFPGFSPTTYYLIGEESAEPAQYQIVAVSDAVPDFQMIFTVNRYSDASGAEATDPQWIWETGTGAAWMRSPDYTNDPGVSLSELAGQEPYIDESSRDQILTDFVSAHPGKIVSDFVVDNNVSIRLLGIDESALDDWMGDTTTFESQWGNDIASGTWIEGSFTE